MINKIFNILRKCNVSDVVNTMSQDIRFNDYGFCEKKAIDARSATFESLGIAKMKDARIALVIDERYISNAYTAITEIWFQRKNILIITVNANLYQPIEYLNRCLVGSSIMTDQSDLDELCDDILEENGPFLLRTELRFEDAAKTDYGRILTRLNNVLDKNDVVTCYNPDTIQIPLEYTLKTILEQHKYCSLSKYVGQLLSGDMNHILCIPECLLAYDSNIFNFRNLPESFMVIVIADDSQVFDKLRPWIKSNAINVVETADETNIEVTKKTVFYYNR